MESLSSSLIDLSNGWRLRYERMKTKIEEAPLVLRKTDGWMDDISVPCDIHEALIDHKIIQEPAVALNCFDAEWVEKKSWWYVKKFTVDEDFLLFDTIELSIEVLDIYADIMLNGCYIACHTSAFYEFIKNVKKYLMVGENVLVIRLTTGLEYVSENDTLDAETAFADPHRRDDPRRLMLRKPQYTFGWDWCPRVASCGIMSPVYLIAHRKLVIRSAYVYTESILPEVKASFHIEIENLQEFHTEIACVHMQISDEDGEIFNFRKEVILKSGINYLDDIIALPQAKLWWPNGAGEQHLYTVKIWAEIDRIVAKYYPFKTGFRTFTIRQDSLGGDEHEFAFEVNGIKMYSKGANYVPPDLLQSRITDDTYRALVDEAVQANFNTLRVWGGGLYERHAFYDCCDEKGILVWQDFAFACAVYPETENFRREVEKEMLFQVRRLRHHASLVMMCGNNEMHWGFDGGGFPEGCEFGGGTYYNFLAPSIIHANAPHLFYWNGSPYGGKKIGNYEMGDAHIWNEIPWNKDQNRNVRADAYDDITHAKFVSEYGYYGACCKETTQQYMGTCDITMSEPEWSYHINNGNKNNEALSWIDAIIEYNYCPTDRMKLEDFILFSGLCQGLMYEYSLTSFRNQLDNYGGLFWMYNDCWGEVGWTIIDYYLKRKISFPFVRRAFAPLLLIIRKRGDTIIVTGVNDTAETVSLPLCYGYFYFNSSEADVKQQQVVLPAFSRQVLLTFPWQENNPKEGSFFVSDQSGKLSSAILRQTEFRHLNIPKAKLYVTDINYSITENGKIKMIFDICADSFAHAVHFNFPSDVKVSDEYFDLMPKEKKTIVAENLPKDFKWDFCINIICTANEKAFLIQVDGQ